MSGTIFSICLTSAIFKLSLLLSEFHLCQLPKNDGENHARRERRSEDCGKVMPTLNLASHAATSSSTVQSRKVRGYSGNPVNLIRRAQGDLQREKTIKTQRRVLKCENRCNVGREYEETRSGRSEPGTLEFPWKSQEYEETRRYRKPRHRRYWQDLATQSPYIYCLRTTCWKGFLERETKIWSQPRRQKWKISMWMRLYGEQLCPSLFKLQLILDGIIRELTFHQESSLCDHWNSWFKLLGNWSRIRQKLQVFQWSIGSSKCGKGQPCWLTRQSSSRLHKPMSFPIQCCDWEASVQTPSEHGRTRLICSWNHISLENGIESTWSRWSSSGIFSQDSLH